MIQFQSKEESIYNQKISHGIFTSVGKYNNSDVELTVKFPPIYLGQPF